MKRCPGTLGLSCYDRGGIEKEKTMGRVSRLAIIERASRISRIVTWETHTLDIYSGDDSDDPVIRGNPAIR